MTGVKSQFGQMWNDFAQSCLFKRVFFARFFERVTEKESRDLKLPLSPNKFKIKELLIAV